VQWVVIIALLGLFLSALVIHFSITDGKMSISDWIILKINHTYFRYKLSRHRYINERDFPKLSFPLPLANDSVQLFVFASAVNRCYHSAVPYLLLPFSYLISHNASHLCLSMETALLSGWKYQIIGPTLAKRFPAKLHRGTSYLEKLAVLQVALAACMNAIGMIMHVSQALADALPADSVVLWADAYDVVYQGDARYAPYPSIQPTDSRTVSAVHMTGTSCRGTGSFSRSVECRVRRRVT